MANTLKFGGGVWATKKGSTLAYNDENSNYKPLPFDFSRASSATRVNKAGLIETVGSGEPRIDYTDSADGAFLLEKAATNLFPYSQYYGSGGLEVTALGTQTYNITNDYSVSPDGNQNALRFQATVGGSSSDRVILRDTLTTTAVDSTLSLYAKSNTTSNYTLVFHYQGGTRDTFVVTPEWQRFTYSDLSNTINNVGIELKGDETSLEADVSLYGFQFENNSYATSYIPTSGSAVTRIADSCSQTPPDGVIGQTEGVAYVEIDWKGNDEESIFSVLHDGTVNNRMDFGYSAVFNSFYFNVRTGGSGQGLMQYASPTIGKYKIAISYKNNDFALWVNGVKEAVDSSGSVPVTTQYNVGNYIGGGREHSIINSKLYNTETRVNLYIRK
jgi:hypothetical protein